MLVRSRNLDDGVFAIALALSLPGPEIRGVSLESAKRDSWPGIRARIITLFGQQSGETETPLGGLAVKRLKPMI